jgi:threonine dehydrogenase-like Zn-dependent dehydrogenase
MPLELVAVAPRTPVVREYELGDLQPGEVRIRTQFATPKHGTELALYRNISPFNLGEWDEALGLFIPREKPEEPLWFPMPLGNIAVGEVIEIGSAVTDLAVGDRVYGHLPIREVLQVPSDAVKRAPEGMSAEAICYWDPAEFALGAVRDAQVRLGERVAVFGMGAIGLMAAQMARLSGAEWVAVVDPIPMRREAALRHGADIAYDPTAIDVALSIKTTLDRPGVDVAIEASGNYRALHEAIRCTHLGGRVVPLAFYTGEAKGLFLGAEWHMNRITMVSSRSISDPNRDHPMWDSPRITEYAFRLLQQGKLRADDLVTPIVSIKEAANAYRDIDEHPDKSIKMGVRFS